MEVNMEHWLEIAELAYDYHEFGGMVIRSEEGQRLLKTILRLGPYGSTVLIQGESGTGKDLAAQALHQSGPNPNGPFVIFNCSNLIDSLADSQLFGHVKGAFTDAREEMSGYFRSANGGTLFLDEVGELPLALQPKLLRTVETHEVQPVGSSRSFKVDIRLVVATNRDLRSMVAAGTFRADLYYRLNATTLRIPPLRQRREAIGAFIAHFVRLSNKRFGKEIRYISQQAYDFLLNHDWPGNLRELRHAIEAAVILAEHDRIGVEGLPETILEQPYVPDASDGSRSFEASINGSFDTPLAALKRHGAARDEERYSEGSGATFSDPSSFAPRSYTLDEAIKAALLRALRKANGNCHLSAKLLGISRYTVYRMMARYGLGEVRNYRDNATSLAQHRDAS